MLNEAYTGTPKTVLEIMKAAYGQHGAQSWAVRKFFENVIMRVRSRDYVSEALAVYYFACSPRFRYTHDPTKLELVKSPGKLITEIETRGVAIGDCDDMTSFICGGLSVIGVPARIGTGSFDVKPDLWPYLGKERPEAFGFDVQGSFAGGPFTHVWAEGMRPDGAYIIMDPVAGPFVAQMRRRLKQVRYYEV